MKTDPNNLHNNTTISGKHTMGVPKEINYREVASFIEHHFRHFNAAVVVDAARAYRQLIDQGGAMVMSIAGAMSTAELGIILAEMIRREKVHAISSTGANMEEDVFNLCSHKSYKRIANYRYLTANDEMNLYMNQYNRVTDTCIPEDAFKRVENPLIEMWVEADAAGIRLFPHEFMYELLRSGRINHLFEIDPQDSWMWAACEKNLPMFVPGWEDSTLGNIYAAHCLRGNIKNVHTVRNGVEYMMDLCRWYLDEAPRRPIGFFQIGGGIAGDFAICVVPLLRQDLKLPDTPAWSYYCQISDSTTSYGSYSGAVPNEKITWGKLEVDTPSFIIESDASIVAPLIFALVLAEE